MAGGFSGGIFSHLKNVELESRNVAFFSFAILFTFLIKINHYSTEQLLSYFQALCNVYMCWGFHCLRYSNVCMSSRVPVLLLFPCSGYNDLNWNSTFKFHITCFSILLIGLNIVQNIYPFGFSLKFLIFGGRL